MRSKKEYMWICAEIFQDLRQQAKLSKARMAREMHVDERTYSRYEDGTSSPTLPAFLSLLDRIDAPALNTIMRHLYPESYGRTGPGASTDQERALLCDYINSSASDRAVRQLLYILHGPHGSPVEAQLQLFTALDHLPMDTRLAIAKLTINAWEIEAARGKVINPDDVLPDIELLRQAVIKAQAAVIAGRSNYTTATE